MARGRSWCECLRIFFFPQSGTMTSSVLEDEVGLCCPDTRRGLELKASPRARSNSVPTPDRYTGARIDQLNQTFRVSLIQAGGKSPQQNLKKKTKRSTFQLLQLLYAVTQTGKTLDRV